MGGKERSDGVGIFESEKLVNGVVNVKRHSDNGLLNELREGIGIDDIISVLQQNRLQCMCCEKNSDWVKKCMEYDVKGSRPRGRL